MSLFIGAWCREAGEEDKLWADWGSHFPGRSLFTKQWSWVHTLSSWIEFIPVSVKSVLTVSRLNVTVGVFKGLSFNHVGRHGVVFPTKIILNMFDIFSWIRDVKYQVWAWEITEKWVDPDASLYVEFVFVQPFILFVSLHIWKCVFSLTYTTLTDQSVVRFSMCSFQIVVCYCW